MYLAFDSDISSTPSQISRIYNISNLQLVKSFLQEHSFLFNIWMSDDQHSRLCYSAPVQLCNFFFDPGRCRHLYSMPWIIRKCWEAVKYYCDKQRQFPWIRSPFALRKFFTGSQGGQIPGASLMFSASIGNRPNENYLLDFLRFLSRIPWLDTNISFEEHNQDFFPLAIAQGVCRALVS